LLTNKYTDPVVLDDVLELLDVGRWILLSTLSALGVLQPLFQSPNVVVELLPVFVRAQRAGQLGVATAEMDEIAMLANNSESHTSSVTLGELLGSSNRGAQTKEIYSTVHTERQRLRRESTCGNRDKGKTG
jgi:hypothetical protein